MNRRVALQSIGTGTASVAVFGPVVFLQGCSPKNLSVYVQTVVGTLHELQPLLPDASANIAKAIKIASDFDKAYRDGKFADAIAVFSNLSGVISEIATDAGVDNSTVKVALAVAGIAMRAIAVLLQSQSANPAVANARVGASSEQRRQAALVEKLANAGEIDRLFSMVRP